MVHMSKEMSSSTANVFEKAIEKIRTESREFSTFEASILAYDGAIITASRLPCVVGSLCAVKSVNGDQVTGEVVRIKQRSIEIIPHDLRFPFQIGDKVILSQIHQTVHVGEPLLGRVVDGLGMPLDRETLPECQVHYPLDGKPLNPFERLEIREVLDVGIQNLNALNTIGCGQRIGIVAGSGVGKSVLLSMITKYAAADIIVVALIGERGREVATFAKEILSSESKSRSVIIAVPADRSPLLRIQGAKRATAVAEYFRDQGKNVLLIMDSLTRVAHAQREVGLSLGEQPTSRGYTPSVISLLPTLIERTGTSAKSAGSITSIYTVLADGDDVTSDPVVDISRAILDGHIVLTRELSQQGIYPAIDATKSISRLMNDIVSPEHRENAVKLKRLISKYYANHDLVMMGGYVNGQDQDLDTALRLWPQIERFLKQDYAQTVSFDQSVSQLNDLVGQMS